MLCRLLSSHTTGPRTRSERWKRQAKRWGLKVAELEHVRMWKEEGHRSLWLCKTMSCMELLKDYWVVCGGSRTFMNPLSVIRYICLCQSPFPKYWQPWQQKTTISWLPHILFKAQTNPRLHPADLTHSSTSTHHLMAYWDKPSLSTHHTISHSYCPHSFTSRLAISLLNKNTVIPKKGIVTNHFRQWQQLLWLLPCRSFPFSDFFMLSNYSL